MDTKLVIVATNAFGTGQSSLCRWNGSEHEQRPCPQSVKSYIEKMGFVDHHNQHLELINMHHKCYKWLHSLFFYFISLVAANAWTIHRKSTTSKPLSLRRFTRVIYQNLLKVCLQSTVGHDAPVHAPFSTEHKGLTAVPQFNAPMNSDWAIKSCNALHNPLSSFPASLV